MKVVEETKSRVVMTLVPPEFLFKSRALHHQREDCIERDVESLFLKTLEYYKREEFSERELLISLR